MATADRHSVVWSGSSFSHAQEQNAAEIIFSEYAAMLPALVAARRVGHPTVRGWIRNWQRCVERKPIAASLRRRP